jgi:cyclopropane-fatty-acyl-phospholipid synthase
MTIWQTAFHLAERAPIPDAIILQAIAGLVARTSRSLSQADSDATAKFAVELENLPIALNVEAANAQHYEVPAAFYERVLGSRRKYSCCYYAAPRTTLAEAEQKALSLTVEHAGLADGQSILELGCGWGSLSLWMAEAFPGSRIVAVSNSVSQRLYIAQQAARRRLANLEIVTADMNSFAPGRQFDRVVSVEMFEHMANWRLLLWRMRGWLRPDGLAFVHVFTHRTTPYRFDHANPADWIAQHFFTGGCMPSRGLMRQFPDLFSVEQEWLWEGSHYAWTAQDWLANYDQHAGTIAPILLQTYGAEAGLWRRRWRLFFLATAGLFAFRDGQEWGVSHYLLRPTPH